MANSQLVEAVLAASLSKRTQEERLKFLSEACAGQPGLRESVEALLQARAEAGTFMEQPEAVKGDAAATPALPPEELPFAPTADVEPPPPAAQSPTTEAAGKMIGRYKLLQEIGEGGFGVVYMAEQQEPVQRKVALKIIKPGMDSREIIARFEAERQALALMDHPNIARVLDAGATASGHPYFVMELVKGVPLTEYCNRKSSTTRERLELFVAVCHAVQHAHQKGVIHRDLKPSNILVTLHDGKPVPKVIDFGVAKALSRQLTERTLFTAYGQMIGTPVYMSPEQAEMSGLDVDTRSDVYSLGVLLYELLTGCTPLDARRLRGTASAEIQRIIREEEPPRPSAKLSTLGRELSVVAGQRGTDPDRLRREIAGDLDWIVMKALEKDRNCRYDTANAFGADVERHLRDEPVEARPPSVNYKLRKLARKHKKLLATAAAFAALLLLGSAVSISLAVRALLAEKDAKTQRDAAALAEKKAGAERDEARSANARLEDAHRQLQAYQRDLRRTLYAVRSNLIQAAWDAGNIGRVLELLKEQRPAPGEEDPRGFEWHYWERLCHGDLRTVQLPGPWERERREMAFSPDTRRVAATLHAAEGQGELRIWDTAAGRELIAIRGLSDSFTGAAWSGDGTRLASASWKPRRSAGPAAEPAPPSELKVWDSASGKEILGLEDKSGRNFSAVALSADGGRIGAAIDSADRQDPAAGGETKVWEVATGKPLLTVPASGPIAAVRFHPGGASVAVAVNLVSKSWQPVESSAEVWDIAGGGKSLTIKCPSRSYFESLAFSADGRRLAGSSGGFGSSAQIKLWDAATGEELLAFEPEAGAARGLAFSPNGSLLAGMVKESMVQVWDAATGKARLTLKGHTSRVMTLAFTPDGLRLYSAAADGTVKVWDATASDEPPEVKEMGFGFGAAISADTQRIATMKEGEKAVELKIHDLAGKELFSFELPAGHAHGFDFSRKGERLAAVWHLEPQDVYELKVWDAAAGLEVLALRQSPAVMLNGAAFSPDGKWIASSSAERDEEKQPTQCKVTLWDAATGKEASIGEALPGAWLSDIAFSPDGARIGAITSYFKPSGEWGDADNVVKVWDAASGQLLLKVECRRRFCSALQFGPEGTRIVVTSGSYQEPGEVAVWDAATGREVCALKGHSGRITGVAVSPDGRRIVSASESSGFPAVELKLWDAESGQELLTLNRNGQVLRLAFSPDGTRIVGAGSFGGPIPVLAVWEAAPLSGEAGSGTGPR